MLGQRLGTAAISALLFLTLSCDKAGSDLPLEPAYSDPEDASISGRVMVGEDGLAGVQVSISGPESSSLETDSGGAFTFTRLKRGTYSVVLRGFDPVIHSFPLTQLSVPVLEAGEVKVEFVGSLVPQPPAPATGLIVEANGPESTELSWTDESDDETGFNVERKDGLEGPWETIGATGVDTTTFSDTGLSPNTTYGYRIQSCNDVGCSPYTTEASATTDEIPPAAPADLVAEADGSTAISLAWSDLSGNEDEFQIERRGPANTSWVAVATTEVDIVTYSDPELTPANTYVYRIKACNSVGCSAYTEEARATTDDIPPEAPNGLSAEADGSSAIDLSWSDRSDNEAEFQVERKLGAEGSWSSVGSTDPDDETFRDRDLDPVTTYLYRIRACNDFGCSDYSNEASATTAEPIPEPPTGLSASAAGSEDIDLTWTDESENETEFSLERRKTSGGSWTQIATPTSDATSYDDSDLDPATEYAYRIQACNAGGCSEFSEEASATTDGTSGPNLFISNLYIVQSTQTLDGDVPLVADKAGFLRVFALADGANDLQPDVRVRFYDGGSLSHTETISAPGASVPTSVSESSLAYSWNMEVSKSLISPGLEILAEVDPGNAVSEADESDNRFPESGSPMSMDVRTTPSFDVTFVPVLQNVNGLVGNVSSGNVSSFFGDVLDLLPIADTDGDVHAEYATDAPVLERDNSNGAWGTVLSEVHALRVAEGSSRAYYGVVKTGYSSGIAGMGYLGWPTAIGWDRLPSGAGVAAHEWGHNWNRRHAPGCGAGSPDASYPYADGKIGVWGMDVGPENLKSPATYYDFMSYCGPEWISDYSYKAILEYRQAHGAVAISGPADEEALLVWGRVEEGQIVLEPSFQVNTRAVVPRDAGEYVVEGLAADGEGLFSFAFSPIPVPDGKPGEGHFAFAIPLSSFDEQNLARIRVRGGGGPPGITEPRQGPVRIAGPEPFLTPVGRGSVEITWDGGAYPMALVRDAVTGEILSFGRGGAARFPVSSSSEVEVLFSDGLRSTRPIRRVVR